MRRPIIIAGTVALAAAGGVAVAAPGDGATIAACTNNLRESIRFVDAGVACAAGETLITWNTQGPAGARGPQGATGVTFKRPPAADAAQRRADRGLAKRPKKPPKKLVAKLAAADSEPGEVRAAYRDGPVQLPSVLGAFLGGKSVSPLVVATLPLPAGRWVVRAKANASLEYDPHLAVAAAGDTYDSASCRLAAGVDSDDAWVNGFSGVLAFELVHRYQSPGLVQLRCYGMLSAKLVQIKLVAMRASRLKNTPIGG